MRIKRIIYDDISNGPSFRTSVFMGFCPGVIWNKKTKRYDHCPGCFNSEAWADNGDPLTQEMLNDIVGSLSKEYVDGLSILGGEPMCRENQPITWRLIEAVRERYGWSKTIWLWSGYLLSKNPFNKNRIPKTKWTKKILKNVNVLVDGPFIADKFDIKLKYRGSSNQRVIDLGSRTGHATLLQL